MKVEPVKVEHKVILDTGKLEAYYRSECEKLYSTEQDIADCTEEMLGDFLDQFTAIN